MSVRVSPYSLSPPVISWPFHTFEMVDDNIFSLVHQCCRSMSSLEVMVDFRSLWFGGSIRALENFVTLFLDCIYSRTNSKRI